MGEQHNPLRLNSFILLLLFIFTVCLSFSQEETPKIRIIKKDAEVRIFPSSTAEVFKTLPLGAVFDIEERIDDWFRITVQSEIGVKVTGYVRLDDVELWGTNLPFSSEEEPDDTSKEDEDKDKKIIRLKDGSLLRGKILTETLETVEIETEFGRFVIRREQISEIQQPPSNKDGKESQPTETGLKPQQKRLDEDLKKTKTGEKRAGEDVVHLNTPPRRIKTVSPEYPPVALNRKIEGSVTLEVWIDEQGKVKDVKILRSFAVFDKAAIKAVRQWAYEPMVIDGRPRTAVFAVTVDFKIK